MKMQPFFKPYRHDRPRRKPHGAIGVFLVLVTVTAAIAYFAYPQKNKPLPPVAINTPTPALLRPAAGQVLGIDSAQTYTADQAQEVARQDYGSATLPPQNGAIKVTFHYRSTDLDGTLITVYGRAYIPTGNGQYPIFAFGPGTTGIGDQCAASLENPKVANWGNYDAHMLMYATQGYAAVTTDYEGMRDPGRIHHYMVAGLEGRALLDAVRALRTLPQAQHHLANDQVVMAGYSQGGHAAFAADTIASTYSPDVTITGVVGFGPVMSVKESIGDVAYGSSLNWFGPYVLASYTDFYKKDYQQARIMQPRFLPNLTAEVLGHCIDTDVAFWGRNPAEVYTPEFLASINADTFATQYPELAADLGKNSVGAEPTVSAKLINQGRNDNVVLPRQQEAVLPGMCAASQGPVSLKLYNATHYNAMVVSLRDTLAWMAQLRHGDRPASTCPPPL